MVSTPRLIIITAPSGSGKTTIVNYLLNAIPQLSFSISACTRLPRANEIDGVNYYFITSADFQQRIAEQAFAEYEMVYPGKYYGTLNSELERIWSNHQYPMVDIDVQGALRLKKNSQEKALSIFIKAPSMQELERRLRGRGTETESSIKERLDKASEELSYAEQFDALVVNDDLEVACKTVKTLVSQFLFP